MKTSIRFLLPFAVMIAPAIQAVAAISANTAELKRVEAEKVALTESFRVAWSEFEAACLIGDARALAGTGFVNGQNVDSVESPIRVLPAKGL